MPLSIQHPFSVAFSTNLVSYEPYNVCQVGVCFRASTATVVGNAPRTIQGLLHDFQIFPVFP